MDVEFKDFIVISKANLKALTDTCNSDKVSDNIETIEAFKLVEYAYEAGKLDAELSLSFDNPKSRFLNTTLTIK